MIIELKQNLSYGVISYTKIKVRTLTELKKALIARKVKTIRLINFSTIDTEFFPIPVEYINIHHFNWLKNEEKQEKYLEIFNYFTNQTFINYKKIS